MQTIGWIIAVVAVVVVIFFHFKQRQTSTMGNLYSNSEDAARDFKVELEIVTDLAIEKLEEKISQLDDLIEEAQEKSDQLDDKIKLAESLIRELEDVKVKNEVSLINQERSIKKRLKPLPKSISVQLNDNAITQVGHKKSSALSGSEINDIEREWLNDELLNNENHRTAFDMIREGYGLSDVIKITGLTKGEIMLLKGLHDRNKG